MSYICIRKENNNKFRDITNSLIIKKNDYEEN